MLTVAARNRALFKFVQSLNNLLSNTPNVTLTLLRSMYIIVVIVYCVIARRPPPPYNIPIQQYIYKKGGSNSNTT